MSTSRPIRPRDSLVDMVGILRDLRLAWRLFRDKRVPILAKAIPVLAAGYVVWPFDLLADAALGLGQLDDVAVLLLGVKLFIGVCSATLVAEHENRPITRDGDDDVIDTTYRVVGEDQSE